jgi:hypothetical protein
MTPFARLLKRFAEKFADRYYEGPDAPERLREMVVAFANDHPKASVGEWTEFASTLCAEAYESGYVRGFEYTERTFDWRPDIPPEMLADMYDPDWKTGRGIQLRSAGAVVPDAEPTEEQVLRSHAEDVFLVGARRRG